VGDPNDARDLDLESLDRGAVHGWASEAAKYLERLLNEARSALGTAEETVREAQRASVKGAIRRRLEETTVEDLAASGSNIQSRALLTAGVRTTADVIRLGRDGLLALDGVGPVTVEQLSEFVGQLRQPQRSDGRLPPDPNRWGASDRTLVGALRALSLIAPALGLPNVAAVSQLLELVRVAQRATRWVSWFTSSKHRKREAVAAYRNARLVYTDPGTIAACQALAHGVEVVRRLTGQREPAGSVEAEWRKNAASLFALLEHVVNGGADGTPVVAAGGTHLTPDLVARIEGLALDTPSLRRTLRGYQSFGAKFSLVVRQGLLGDDMGLGKTIQALAAIGHLTTIEKQRHHLVVCPAQLVDNWLREVQDTLVEVEAHAYRQPRRDDAHRSWLERGGVLVASYEQAGNLATAILPPIGMLVADEAHYVKNPSAARSMTTARLARQSARCLLMSGTLLENRAEEMLRLAEVANPAVGAQLSARFGDGSDALLRADEFRSAFGSIWDEKDWGEDQDGNPLDPPDEVSAAELNKFLFNADTVDKVLANLMTNGIKVAGGDRLGKTILFAKNQRHADFIYERFLANYPHLDNGNFARVITYSVKYGQSLIDDFSIKDKAPHLAISVDMLDTGIDVPECVNLVFFKMARSRTKFWQMIGRGTRLCPDLFGPGDDKTEFKVFDYCGNLEFFSQTLVPAEGSGGLPLGEQIFKARLDLIQTFDAIKAHGDQRAEVAGVLRDAIASMNENNFLVRPHLELVEKFRDGAAWETMTVGDLAALADRVAKLPDQLDPEHEDAKRFDMLLLNAELGVLRGEPYERQRRQVMQIAGALEDQDSIPVIAAQLELIEAIQADEWWVNVSYPMLEEVRKKLRLLVPLIERAKKGVIYSNFADEIGEGVEVVLPGTGGAQGSTEFIQFRKKAEYFLKQHLGEGVVAKVRSGEPLTAVDIADLQRVLVAAGIGSDETFAEASAKAGSFGLFIRSLVGLDRAAAKAAFAEFLDEKRYSKNQIVFVNLIIDELTERGLVEAGRVYESPYDGVAPEGPEAIFVEADLVRLFEALKRVGTLGS